MTDQKSEAQKHQGQGFTTTGLAIWAVCALFFLYEFLMRTVVGTFQHPIMYDLNLSSVEFSILSSTIYLLIYAAMQIPVGLIVDRFGLKKSLFFACILCALSAFGFAFAANLTLALVARVVMGFGSAFGFICLLISVYDWLPAHRRALMVGVSQFVGTMGPMIAAGPLETLAESGGTDWRSVFIYLGTFGLVLSGIVFFVVRNNSEKAGSFQILKRPEAIPKTLKHLVSKPQALFIALFSGLVYFALEYLSENEGKTYIQLKGHSSEFAAYMITLSWLGYAIGCPLTGYLSDLIQRRRPFLIVCAISATLGLGLLTLGMSAAAMTSGFFLLGFGASGQSVAFALMGEQFKKAYLASAMSLNNTLMMFFAGINAPLLGTMIDANRDRFGDGLLSNYALPFYVMLGIVACSMIFPIFLIKETHCKSKADFTVLKRT